ncbi:MAG: hypothetical protein WBG86_04930, partial [Polyangiales bacterium]
KRTYDRVERYAETILADLAPDACFWGNEATMFYPLAYYYQGVLGRRTDVRYSLVFGIVETGHDFERHADLMVQQLEEGCPVYVTSAGYPERHVMNLVYQQLAPTQGLAAISRLPERAFVESFPGFRWDAREVDAADGTRIYRLAPR